MGGTDRATVITGINPFRIAFKRAGGDIGVFLTDQIDEADDTAVLIAFTFRRQDHVTRCDSSAAVQGCINDWRGQGGVGMAGCMPVVVAAISIARSPGH